MSRVLQYSNIIETEIATPGGINGAAVGVTVGSATGLPANTPYMLQATQYDGTGNVAAYERWKVTARSGNDLTISRGQEGTIGVDWGEGIQVTNPLTKQVLTEAFVPQDDDTVYDATNKRLGLGMDQVAPSYRFTVAGSDANNTQGDGVNARAHIVNTNIGAPGRLAELSFGISINNAYAGVGGYLQDAAGNAQGGIVFATRRLTADAALTEAVRISYTGNVGIRTAGEPTANTALDVNGVIASSLGAVGAPSHAFRTDLDTGMWSPAANTLAWSEAGTERMRIDPGDNTDWGVGFGYTAPRVLGVGVELSIFGATRKRGALHFGGRDLLNGDNASTQTWTNLIAGVPNRLVQQDVICDGAANSGTILFYTNNAGAGVAEILRLTYQKNMGFRGSSFGGGLGVVFIGNAATVPTSNPAAGGLLYTEAGALKYRGSSGTVTVLGVA